VLPLSDDLLEAAGPRQAVLPGGDPWEAAFGDHVVEGPWMRRQGDTYYQLLYSGGAYTGAYGMGYATGSSPTGPFTKSSANPILRGTPEVIGPGGGSAVVGPGGGDWLAYHGRTAPHPSPRLLRIDRLRPGDDGSLAVDGPTTTPQPVP
jgi:beta-xylosidase